MAPLGYVRLLADCEIDASLAVGFGDAWRCLIVQYGAGYHRETPMSFSVKISHDDFESHEEPYIRMWPLCGSHDYQKPRGYHLQQASVAVSSYDRPRCRVVLVIRCSLPICDVIQSFHNY